MCVVFMICKIEVLLDQGRLYDAALAHMFADWDPCMILFLHNMFLTSTVLYRI